jgi:hypothetical protein
LHCLLGLSDGDRRDGAVAAVNEVLADEAVNGLHALDEFVLYLA